MVTAESQPMRECLIDVKVNFQKKYRFPYWEISLSCTGQEFRITLQHRIIWFSLYYLSHGLLHEVKNKEKIQTFSPKSDRGRLQEVPNKVILLGNFSYFWKLAAEEPVVAYETWSQPEVPLYVFYLGKLQTLVVSLSCQNKQAQFSLN